jgi:hypothetical protein
MFGWFIESVASLVALWWRWLRDPPIRDDRR